MPNIQAASEPTVIHLTITANATTPMRPDQFIFGIVGRKTGQRNLKLSKFQRAMASERRTCSRWSPGQWMGTGRVVPCRWRKPIVWLPVLAKLGSSSNKLGEYL
jgi:hypothetical protein